MSILLIKSISIKKRNIVLDKIYEAKINFTKTLPKYLDLL